LSDEVVSGHTGAQVISKKTKRTSSVTYLASQGWLSYIPSIEQADWTICIL